MFVNRKITINVRKACYVLLTFGILSILSLPLIPQLLPESSFADEPITVNPSITIGNSGSLSLSVNPNQFNSANQSITVTTSNYTGYTMTIAPSSGVNTELVNSETNTTIPSISSELTSSQFTNLSSTRYGLSINGGSNYLPVENGSTIKTTNSATNATTGAFTLTLGAKAVSGTPAGTYTKSFMLTAQANDAAYNITYDKNLNGASDTTGNFPSSNEATVSGTVLTLSAKTPTRTGYEFLHWNTVDDDSGTSYNVQGTINLEPTTANPITLYAIWQKLCPGICYNGNNDDGTGTMPDQTVSNLSSSQTLRGNNYSRSGYGFAGWSEDEDAYARMTDNDGTNDPTIYGPNQTVTMPGHTLNLYAVWVPAEKDGNDDPVYLQGWNGCSSLDPNEVIALTDSRDNSVYAIARIVDNVSNPTYSQCWMTENLRLDVADSNITYTNNNTNHPASSFLAQKDAFTSGSPTWQTCEDSSIACDDQISYSLANLDRANTASYSSESQTSSWYSHGGMYNWFTATAGNGLYGMSSSNANTAGDLCPNGWHLPTGGTGTTTDYKSLNSAINSGATNNNIGLRAYPANFLYSGRYKGASAEGRGSLGNYWSSTTANNSSRYNLGFGGTFTNPGTSYNNNYVGLALRCLAGNSNYYIIYDANGGTGYGDPQSLGSTAPDGTTTTTLTASNFSKTGYGFAGWSRNPNADPNEVNATTEIYGPNATITVPDSTSFDSNKNLTLYAIWVPLAKDSNNNDLTFQTTNLLTTTLSDNSTLDSKSNGYVTALKDTRDNEVYAVAKLADGNYWMIENMRLDLSSNNTTITTSNTNHPTQAFVTDINTNYKGKADDPNTTLWKTCTDETPACIDQTSFAINNLDRLSSSPIVTSPIYKNYGWRSYGIYYNWYTATGGHGTYNKTSSVADGDLCPFGWHLPYGGFGTNTRDGNTPGGFYYLNRMLNNGSNASDSVASSNLRRFPNNFALSGYFFGSSGGRVNENGYFWSNSANSDHNANNMELYVTGVRANYNYVKYSGQSIRCLANTTETFTLSYNANGGTGAPAADPGGSSNTNSYDFTLSSTEPTRSGLTFAGWATEQNATEESTLYQPGQTYTFYQPSTTLYAVWVPEVIIHFNGSGGTGSMTDQGVPSGTSRPLRHNTFSKSGVNFAGWTTTEGSTNVEYADGASYTAPVVTGPDPLEVTLYAVWGRSRTIMYNINTDDANANGTMGNQSVYEYAQAELWASNFARPNYGFAGWSENPNAQPGDGTSVIYGPNETITVPAFGEGSSTMTLYAVWVAPEAGVTMQTFNPNDSTYSSKPIGSVIALNDSRDTNVYTVAKLADGNWWMTENLRLNPADSNTTINASNTNNPTSTFINTDITLANIQDSTGKKAYTNPYFRTCADTDSTNGPLCMDQISFGLGNITSSTSNRTSSNQTSRWYSYGAMYSWYTATAGHGTYSKASGVTDGDICPAGWHLPYGGSDAGSKGGNTSGGFYYLNYKLNNDTSITNVTASNNIRKYPNNFVYSGHFHGSSSTDRGSSGRYWSSTTSGNTIATRFEVSRSSVDSVTYNYSKVNGYAVRCVASPRQTLTLSFDTTKVASVEIDGTSYNNGDTISLVEGSTHTINMTFQTGYEFDSWSISGTGSSVASTSTNPTTLTMGTASATLTATAKVPTATCTKRYALQNADGTYSAYTVDTTEQVAIGATCSYSKTVTDYQTRSTSGTMTSNGLTLDLQLPRNTYTLTVSGSSDHFSSTTGGGTYRWGQTVNISATVKTGHSFTSWSQSGTSGSFGSTSSASTTFTMGKGAATVTAGGQTNSYTCTKRYRLQNANGTFPSTYTSDGSSSVAYGSTCSYSKTVTDYRGSSSAANGAQGSTSCTMGTGGCTLSLDFYRNTYTLTINRNTTYISSVSGGGSSKLWGSSVSISATLASNSLFNGWSQTAGTTGSFASTSNASTTFTMPKSNATIYADGKASCTSSITGDMQNALAPSAYCTGATGTMTDRRTATGSSYALSNVTYTIAKLDGKLWMTQNLRLRHSIPATGSNFTSPDPFNASRYAFSSSSSTTTCDTKNASSSSPKGYSNVCSIDGTVSGNSTAYYNFAAASAGSITGYSNSNASSADICPSGWHLPTNAEFTSLVTALGSNVTPFNPIYSGGYTNTGSLVQNFTLGYWWSATAASTTAHYVLKYESGSLSTAYVARSYGISVRCVKSS